MAFAREHFIAAMPGASAQAKAQFFDAMPGASVSDKLSGLVQALRAAQRALQVEADGRIAAELALQAESQARLVAESELDWYRSRPVVEADALLSGARLELYMPKARAGGGGGGG